MSEAARPSRPKVNFRRAATIDLSAALIGLVATAIAKGLIWLIAVVTNVVYFHQLQSGPRTPAEHHLGPWAILIPAVGGLIVGLMARYGSAAIRGHGIPEAMEQVLTNGSRIQPRIAILKPVSSAIAIGTGGPFGAEGPIIATGGALGSLLGQLMHTTGLERKVLLASGAVAGMTAIFGCPLAAIALAIELLLFELRASSLIPVAIACTAAASARQLVFESGPVFAMHATPIPDGKSIVLYGLIGLAVGWVSVWVTRLVYLIEDGFEKLPIHWAWWPAIGGLVVGVVGYFAPRTLGVGYNNITDILNGNLVWGTILVLGIAKFVSWSIALGSGTSGGTLAPLLTIGGALGFLGGQCLGVNPQMGALVGMAALFAGASRALLTSVIFAVETTGQSNAFAALVAGCAASYLVSRLLQENTIMTEKIVRRGVKVPSDYFADELDRVTVGTIGKKHVATFDAHQALSEARSALNPRSHHGFPVLDEGRVIGVLTMRDLLNPDYDDFQKVSEAILQKPILVDEFATVREAADLMAKHSVGRLPIVDQRGSLVGILTRSDVLSANIARIVEEHEHERGIELGSLLDRRRPQAS